MAKMRRYRAALIGYYGFGNLGDELLLRASLEVLNRCGVENDSIAVLSNAPEETERIYHVASVSRWSFKSVRRVLSNSDTLLLGGGGLFQDSTSLKSCVWYWGLVRMARLCGARPWALGQSIGPLRSHAARMLTRWALGSCAALQVRDMPSMHLAEDLGLNAISGEDLVLTLTPPAVEQSESDKKVLLINLRPDKDAERYAALIAPYVNAFDGETVGVAMSREDAGLLESLKGTPLNLSRVVLLKSLEDASQLWSTASEAIGMRLHFAVLSAVYGTPLAALPYDPKVAAFAERVGAARMDNNFISPHRPVLPVSIEKIRADVGRICESVLNL